MIRIERTKMKNKYEDDDLEFAEVSNIPPVFDEGYFERLGDPHYCYELTKLSLGTIIRLINKIEI